MAGNFGDLESTETSKKSTSVYPTPVASRGAKLGVSATNPKGVGSATSNKGHQESK